MDIQSIIAILCVAGAGVYVFYRAKKNWQKGDEDPKCENCEVPDLLKKQREKDEAKPA